MEINKLCIVLTSFFSLNPYKQRDYAYITAITLGFILLQKRTCKILVVEPYFLLQSPAMYQKRGDIMHYIIAGVQGQLRSHIISLLWLQKGVEQPEQSKSGSCHEGMEEVLFIVSLSASTRACHDL